MKCPESLATVHTHTHTHTHTGNLKNKKIDYNQGGTVSILKMDTVFLRLKKSICTVE